MSASRTLAAFCICILAASPSKAQTYTLAETVQPGTCFRVGLNLTLTGEMRINRDGEIVPLKMNASATHEFPERVLSVGAQGLPDKVARVYEKAAATITVERDRSERTLRDSRRLLVMQRAKDQSLVYSPAGPLTREELELTSEHFDTLSLPGLLPGKMVAVGDTWKISNAVAQALGNFEGLTDQNLVGKLEEVKGDGARISITGTANGIDLGALTKLTIEATLNFDLAAHRITRVEWKQKDERESGPASPATSVQTTTLLTRAGIDQPDSLSDVALVSVPDGFEPPPVLTQLEFHDSKGRFDIVYARDWQTLSESADHVVFRLMERGDFVAQATLTPWTSAEKGKHLSPDEFRQAMNATPGWEPQQELQAGEVPAEDGRWIYRLSTLGELDGNKVMQNFYLIAGPEGEQLVVAITMTPKQADRLGTRDLSMVANLQFPSSKPKK